MADVVTVPLDDNFGAGDALADVALDPVEDSPENLKKKADEYDARNAGDVAEEEPGTGVPAMPADGHAKFYNKESGEYNWKDHSTELQYKLNQKAQPPAQPKKVEIKIPDPKAKPEDSATIMQENFEAMAEEFAANGELSPENRTKLNGLGFTDIIINQYLQGIQATNELVSTKSVTLVGSQEKLDAILQWAGNNLKSEAAALNEQLGNPQMWENTLLGLQARYNSALGTDGEIALIDGDATGGEAVAAYETPKQYRDDIRTQRYKDSAIFRTECLKKMQAAMANGVEF